jgi:glycosyltransferase involved in cell wall biosynthesis
MGDFADGQRLPAARPSLGYVVNSLNPGGTEKLVVEMSLAFAPEFDVSVYCLDEPGVWATDLRDRGIPVHCLWRQPGVDLAIPMKLARHFRRWGTQIIHAHQCTPWFYAALSRLLYSAPRLLLEEHGRFFPEVYKLKRVLLNRMLIKRLTHRFVAVSEDIRQRLVRYEGLGGCQIDVVYNGVRPELPLGPEAREALRQGFGFEPESFVVGTVGRFDPIKNLPILVESLARACREISTLRGFLVGNGPMFADVGSLVEQAGLSDRIQMLGFREDARKLIQSMDLFVLSSFSEGTSMALLEAIAAGVPVVVTNVGGNPEVVANGYTGWVVPSDSADDLTAAILEALKDVSKRQQFATAGQRRFEERFTFDRMIDGYRQQYGTLLSMRA